MPQPIQQQQSGIQQQQQDPFQSILKAGLPMALDALFPGSGAAAGGLMGLFSSLFGGGQEQPAQSAAVQTPGDGGSAGSGGQSAGGGSEQLKVPEEKKQEETKVEPVKTEVPQGLASTASLSPEQKVPVMTGDAPAAAPGGEGQAAGGSLIPPQDPYQDPLILAALSQARQEGGWM